MNEMQRNTQPQTFWFGETPVRGLFIDGEAWLVGKDVAQGLGYANHRKAIADHVEEEDKGVTKCYSPGGMQEVIIINEPGVYQLTFRSKLPGAKQFTRWVTHEVLPQIRKTGGYGVPVAETKEATVGEVYGGMAKLLASVASLHKQGVFDTADAKAAVMGIFENAKIPLLSMKERVLELDRLALDRNDVQRFIDEVLERSEGSLDWKTLYSAFCAWAGYTLDEFGLPMERDSLSPRQFSSRMKKAMGIEGANGDCIYLNGKSARGLKNWVVKSDGQKKPASENHSEAECKEAHHQ